MNLRDKINTNIRNQVIDQIMMGSTSGGINQLDKQVCHQAKISVSDRVRIVVFEHIFNKVSTQIFVQVNLPVKEQSTIPASNPLT